MYKSTHVITHKAALVVEYTLDHRHDSTLLDCRRALEAIGVDAWGKSASNLSHTFVEAQSIPRNSSAFRFMESKESVTSS